MQTPVRVTSGTVRHQRREAGTQGAIVRPVSTAEREALGRILRRLSRRTIYERFHAPYPRVPAWALAGMVEVDRDRREAVVAGEAIVGHAMYAREGAAGEAEFAVVVEDGWQSKGVGRLLLAELVAKARLRSIDLFTGTVLGENRRALDAFWPPCSPGCATG